LDIDGTVTAEAEGIPSTVVSYLASLYKEGWEFIFITGRPFQWSARTLKVLPFPFTLGVQNGALLLRMPSIEIISRKYLGMEWLVLAEEVCASHGTDFIIYTGFEKNDCCYYRPHKLPEAILNYLQMRKDKLGELWVPYEGFNELPIDDFAAIKCFAPLSQAAALSQEFEATLGLHAPLIKDPFSQDVCVIQATHSEATKGGALREFLSIQSKKGPVLAAGNDYNDLSLLALAHIKIVMEDAPEKILKMAHIVAPAAEKMGIINALEEGIRRREEFYA